MNSFIKPITLFFLTTIFFSSLYAIDKEVTLKKGWNQIRVPLEHIKLPLLVANSDIEVIWSYQLGKYNLLTNNLQYRLLEKKDNSIGVIRALSYGESIYVLATTETTLTFVGNENLTPPVRSGIINSSWTQMSKNDFASNQWNVISKIVGDNPVIAAKIVMKDERPSIKIYSNNRDEANRIKANSSNFFEDFEVTDDEAFWIKDVSNVDNISTLNFAITGEIPTEGADIVKFNIDATSSNKKRHYLALKIIAIKDGDIQNKEHELFNDYIKLNEGSQEIKAIMPMLEDFDNGTYRIYAIKDLSAQYDAVGIDIFNLEDVDKERLSSAYKAVLDNSEYIDISLNGNKASVTYDMKVASREYANSVLFYNPLNELNRLAKNQSKDLSELSYTNIGRHTEFQLTIRAYGNSGNAIAHSKLKAYITVNGVKEPIIVLGEGGDLKTEYEVENMKISLPSEEHDNDVALSVMIYGEDALNDNKNLDLYNKIMAEFEKTTTQKATYDFENDISIQENKICLDTSCSQWIFKKDFTISFSLSDSEPTKDDEIATTIVTLYSDTFSSLSSNSYESKDTSTSLTNLLLREDVYSDDINKRRVGTLGADTSLVGTDILIEDLTILQEDLKNAKDERLLFDPLITYENALVNLLIFTKDEDGSPSQEISDTPLHDAWNSYVSASGSDNICDRQNYFGLSTPYIKKVQSSGEDDLNVLTATDDLCLYNVKYSHLQTLNKVAIENIATTFKTFVLMKNSRNEEERIADFWNPLFSFDNSTLHMPEGFFKTLPVVNKRIGGGASFSAKLALDSELNEIRAATYADVDVALIKEFKLFDLDFETVVSGSDPDASRFDMYMYSINPVAKEDKFTLKKIIAFHQPIPTTYATSEKVDITIAKKIEIDFSAGPVGVRFEFEVGNYSYFMIGVDLDMSEKFMIYAVPGSRIYGTIAGGLSFSLAVLKLDVELRADDFTVVRAAVPVVAMLDNFRLDREGFSTDFKLFSNIELRVAEVLLNLNVKISAGVSPFVVNIVDLEQVLWDYQGIDPLASIAHVGTGLESDVTDCQSHYYGWELFCVKKTLDVKFKFSGLSNAECSLLDLEYLRRSEVDGDTTYLYSTNEYRKVRGCVNDSYEFENITIEDWQLSAEQWDDINNITFWKWDSRATISRQLEESGIELEPTMSEILSEVLFGEEPEDRLNDAWKELTGIDN